MRNSAAPIIVNTKPKIASPNCFIIFLSLCKTKLLASKIIDFIFYILYLQCAMKIPSSPLVDFTDAPCYISRG